jgi:SAM-dependent methyltransferase
LLKNSSGSKNFSRALLFGTTIFISAFLLFAVEPLIAKRILPWFGGSSAVWSTCLVFFQCALLAGYWYAQLLTRYSPARLPRIVHIAVLLAALAVLPIGPSERWRPGPDEHPFRTILILLTATIGLPFLALSATTPLLQDWLARAGDKAPYRLFALSNLASLAALVGYPLLVEPNFDTTAQARWWSMGYALFALLCATTAWQSRPRPARASEPAEFHWINPFRKISWFALAACGSMLLLSITNHITQNVAAVPLLWVVPLAVYLLTFILAFAARQTYNRALWLRLLAFALAVLAYAIFNINAVDPIQISLPIFILGLFACCMFCHGELNRLRPEAYGLTNFYLIIALGSASGAIFVGLVAPQIFEGIYELPLTLVLTAGLASLLTWRDGAWPLRALWVVVAGAMVLVFAANVKAYREHALSLRRSFYGSLRVVQSPHAGLEQNRTLFHGTIEHGAQFLWPPMRSQPTTYYGTDSGVGIVLRDCFRSPKRVAVVGLGVATLAAYGKPGDTFRFYEINPQVVDLATSLFFYLRETHADVKIVEGDARLSLEREAAPRFDVFALDAFSGDAIPVHLLTREAMALYRKHLNPEGVLAFHVSNNYLDLAPVVRQLAEEAGYQAVLVKSGRNDQELILAADWVLVTNNRTVLDNPVIKLHSVPIDSRAGLRPWTDNYNNLLQILKTPEFHQQGF